MRKPNNANKFIKSSKLVSREAKINHLTKLNDSEARKVLKQMRVINMGGPKANARGFYGKVHPVKCSVKAKTRHTTSAFKSIMTNR